MLEDFVKKIPNHETIPKRQKKLQDIPIKGLLPFSIATPYKRGRFGDL